MKFFVVILCFFTIFHWGILCHNCTVNSVGKNVSVNCSYRDLKFIPSDLPKTATLLDLSHNDFFQLTSDAFAKFTELKSLNLNKNSISYINVGAFAGLEHLELLSLNKNSLNLTSAYPEGIFRFLTSLKTLDIRWNFKGYDNDYSEIVYPNFKNLVNLTDLYLDLTPDPNFMSSGLAQLENLRIVRFDDCYVKHLSRNIFDNFPESVKELYFKSNKAVGLTMTITNKDVLQPLRHLQVLSFDNIVCNFSQALELLSPFVNKSMEAIIYRRVRSFDERSVFLTEKMMSYLLSICVKTLVLAQDWIVDFETHALSNFTHPQCLENIILSGNRFAILSTSAKRTALSGLSLVASNLKLFDYSFNPLEYSYVSYFDVPYLQNTKGEGQLMSTEPSNIDCRIPYIENSPKAKDNTGYNNKKNDFQMSENGVETDITEWQNLTIHLPRSLEVFRTSHLMTTEAIIGQREINVLNAINLRFIDMSYLPLTKIKGLNFIGGLNIEYLDVSGINSKVTLSESAQQLFENTTTIIMKETKLGATFKENPTLLSTYIQKVKTLNISKNNIWYIDRHTFTKSPSLTHLNLSHNLLSEIPIAVTSIHTLEILDIRFNWIQAINATMQSWIDNQAKLKSSGTFTLLINYNDFHCNCETIDFVQWLFQTKVNLDLKDRNYNSRLKNGTMSDMSLVYAEFHDLFKYCDSLTWLQIGIFSVVLLLIIVIAASLIHKFKWQILYWFYKKFKNVISNEIHQTFKYDIYLSYAVDRALWIKNSFVPMIEKSWKMKICIQERDILGGEIFADSVAIAIKESRIFICIISEEFKNREWGMYEIERAKYEKFTKNVQKLVIIMKGASISDFPIKQFENVWKDIVIIDWPEYDNEKGWNELRIALFAEF